MNPFVKFMASPAGRITRIVLGIILIAWGFFGNVTTWVGYLLMVIGLVALLAGAFDFCLLAPLFGAPMNGKKIRGGQ